MEKLLLYVSLILCMLGANTYMQPQTLSSDDIYFIGFHLDDTAGFTITTLRDLPEGQVIYATDHSRSVTFS